MTMSDALAFSKSRSQTTKTSSHLEARADSRQQNTPTITSGASGHRVVKRRASRACHYCRAKKIKCSVVKSGSPCNTCRLDEVECLVSMVRRKRRPRVNGVLVDLPSTVSLGNLQQWEMFEESPPTIDDVLVLSDAVNHNEGGGIPATIGV